VRTAFFIVVSFAAYYVAFYAAVLAHFYLFKPFETGPLLLPELFLGGLVGAFAILAATLVLLFPKARALSNLVKGLYWSPVGGFLAVIGTVLGSVFGQVRRILPSATFHGTDVDVSLMLVWQTGMALAIALMLSIEGRRSQEDGLGAALPGT